MIDPAANNVSAFPGQRLLTPRLRRMSDVVPQRIKWLSRGRLAVGKITILDGDPGLGKSTITLDWAARITRGEALPDGEPGKPRSVIILSAEDDEGDTIHPRLVAAGADLSKVFVFWMNDEDGNEYLPGFPHDLVGLMGQVEATDASLVIVDPFMAFLASDIKSNSDQDVRRALSPLSVGLARTGSACLISRHLNKATGMSSLYRGGGSIGIIGAARFGLLVAKDPEDESGQRRILAVQKCNIGPEAGSLAYHMESVPGSDVARVVWEGESHHRAQALTDPPRTQAERADAEDARAWLADTLANGPVLQREIKRLATKDGMSWRTIAEVKARLGVQSKREGFGAGSSVSWVLPTVTVHGQRLSHGAHSARPYSANTVQGQKTAPPSQNHHTAHSVQSDNDDPFSEDDE